MKTIALVLAACAAALLLPATSAAGEEILRPPIAAGQFYPDNAEALLKTIRGYYNEASASQEKGRLVGAIVPHSAYGFSGKIAAGAFEHLQPGQYDRVIILSPAHFVSFEGLSVPGASAFVTPLGIVPLDGDALKQLAFSPLIGTRSLRYDRADDGELLHEQEHGIEVLLPFLQERLGEFHLVPVLVGEMNDARGNPNSSSIEAAADAIASIVTPRTLIIASSDFTHFGNDFSFRPFNQQIPETIQKLDEAAMRLIVKRHVKGFQEYLMDTENPICGKVAIQIFMHLLPQHTVGRVVDYDMSMSKTGNENRSVSYASITFYDPSKKPAEARPKAHNPYAVPQAQISPERLSAAGVRPAPAEGE